MDLEQARLCTLIRGNLYVAAISDILDAMGHREDEFIDLVRDKVESENASRRKILEGKSLREVYTEYGVL